MVVLVQYVEDRGGCQMIDMEDMEECLSYFKERKVFEKIFSGFWKKYESLGRIGGTVILKNLPEEEREQLSGFLRKDCHGKKQVSVSAKAFEEALEKSKFSEISFQEILENYFNMPLVAKKEEQERREREIELFFERVLSSAEEPSVKSWLETCQREKNSVFQYIEREWKKNSADTFAMLQVVCMAGECLPCRTESYELLPVFAARLTKDPHAFDSGTAIHYFLCSYLQFLFPDVKEDGGSHTEQVWALFFQGGILKDDLSNSVLLYGFHGVLPDGGLHDGLEGFFEQKEPVSLTLLSLSRMKELYPASGSLPNGQEKLVNEKGSRDIYMVENPAVFSYLFEKYPKGSFICGNGQQRMAVWVLLSKIPKEYRIFYAGDFDPEGLGIAQRLKQRFPEQVQLWKYEVGLYRTYMTSNEISEQRLKKLDAILLPELSELCACMKEKKAAVYQEALLAEYQIG